MSDAFYRRVALLAGTALIASVTYTIGYILGIARMAGRCP
jgi:hypothetical protein